MKNLGKTILSLVGNEKNIKTITHCATRLRFTFYDNSMVEVDKLRELEGVVGVVEGSQFQVIIGINVNTIYNQLIDGTNLENKKIPENKGNKKPLAAFLDIVVSLFTPLLPLLAGSGLLRGFIILSTQIGILDDTSSTYTILTVASTAVFHFLPVLLAITCAKKFNSNTYIAVAIMGALIMPEFQGIVDEIGVGNTVSFLGMPVVLVQYTGSVIPSICAIFCQSKLEAFLKKRLPESLHMIVVPTISLFIIVPLTAILFGPFGVYIGMGIAKLVNYLLGLNGIIMGAIVGGIWNILIMFGIHWAVNTTVVIPNIALTGESQIIALAAAANFGMAGACLGVFLKTKNKKLKGYATTSIASIFLSGIVEPALYGVGLKYKRPLIAGIIASALGGALMGAFRTVGYSFVFGGITTIPAFAGPTIVWYVLGLLVAFVAGTILTMLFGFKDEPSDSINEDATLDENAELGENTTNNVYNPIEGDICPIEEVKDEVFSKKLLGDGVAIKPTKGKVFAPFDGVIETIFPTKHAIGLVSNDGMEIIIHIGFDTVELNGEHFEAFVEQGQSVTKGQLLLSFDIEKITTLGYDITTPVVITNYNKYKNIELSSDKFAKVGDIIIKATK